jgi:hypothetical protein
LFRTVKTNNFQVLSGFKVSSNKIRGFHIFFRLHGNAALLRRAWVVRGLKAVFTTSCYCEESPGRKHINYPSLVNVPPRFLIYLLLNNNIGCKDLHFLFRRNQKNTFLEDVEEILSFYV